MARRVLVSFSLVPQRAITWTENNYRITADDVTNGLMFLNNGSSFLFVSNPSGATSTVTITAVQDEAGRTNAAGVTGDQAYGLGYRITLNASSARYFGPFRQAWWNQTATDPGYVYVDISRATTAAYVVSR